MMPEGMDMSYRPSKHIYKTIDAVVSMRLLLSVNVNLDSSGLLALSKSCPFGPITVLHSDTSCKMRH